MANIRSLAPQYSSQALLARWVAGVQAAVYISTGLWPVIHMQSFLTVTGPKTDLWLVEAFGLLVAAFGIVLAYAAVYGRVGSLLKLAAFAVASTLAFIDAYYVYRGEISSIYLADGIVELGIAAAWLFLRPWASTDASTSARRRPPSADAGAFAS